MMTVMSQPDLVLCEFLETGVPGLDSFSPFCTKVARALRAAGLRYVSRRSADPGAFRGLNPTGQVPVLLVDDEPIYDSTRILAKVKELVPGAFPDHPEVLLWEELADTHLNGFLVAARWADDRNWPRVRDAYFAGAPWFVRTFIAPRIRARVLRSLQARDVWRAGDEACWASFLATLDAFEARAPESAFWLGSALSSADIALFAQLQAHRTDLTPWQSREIALRPRLSRWLDRVDASTRTRRTFSTSRPQASVPRPFSTRREAASA
jgi:glutathione S-transferase